MNNTNIRLVKLTPFAVKELQHLSKQTFIEAYAWGITEENLQHFISTRFSINKLAAELYNPESEFYFAMKADQPIGYLKINSGQAQTELQACNGLEIERIYVLKEFQGEKIGQHMFSKALQIAREKNAGYLWLGVWDKNSNAIKFYEKNGLVPFSTHVFHVGDEEQCDIMMKLDFRS